MSSYHKTIRLALMIAILVLSASFVLAQESGERALSSGVPVTGTLDSDNAAQVYTILGTQAQPINLTLTTESNLTLALVVTDTAGERVAQAFSESGQASLSDVTLPADGTYYVTVFSISGVPAAARTFELTLEGGGELAIITPPATFTPPGELLTATGLQVSLSWESTANLDLEVRDPIGGSLFFNTPTVESGGRFGTNINSVCANVTANAPTEQASWPAGVIPTGSYEVLVYYQPLADCPTTDPATFRINATVDGTPVPEFVGTLAPNEVYIASFRVNADGTVAPGLSGLKADFTLPSSLPASAQVLRQNAQPIERDTIVTGFLNSAQPYQTYTFQGAANEVVSIDMLATSGSLDTLLVLLDPNGNIVGSNDDRAEGNTNALIANQPLVLAGEYTVVASRYGQTIGGTEGEFSLTLTGPLTGTQTATLPNLPDLPNGAVEVSLQWNTAADLQLLVRDPQGNAVFDDSPQIPSGGRLAANGNVNCRASDGSPVSYIYWPEGRLPAAGPYEVEVWYQNSCNDNSPVNFVLNVVANEQIVQTVTQPLLPNERFLTSFSIGVDGIVAAGDFGIIGTSQRPDVSSLQADYVPLLETARVLTGGQQVNNSIRLNKKFDVYVFDGATGDVVTIGMQGLNGTLDPVLFLLDPNGIQIAQNDDADRETTNSLISDFTLPEDGRYIIIATHFGARYGVTSGDYSLTLRLN